jgi:outer membrane protein OmpA-like peptidoglycan-associated protein
VLWITPGLRAKANFGVYYETETVRIGRPGQSGIFLESQVLHKPLEVIGGAENLALLINGETASIPTDNVQLLVENLNEVVEIKGNTPNNQILFKTEPGLRTDETSWRLKIMDAGGKVVRILGGKGSLPSIVRWDGRFKNGQAVKGGEIYQYQMEVRYADGSRATSARKLFGINQNTAIFLNLTGEAFIFDSAQLSPKAKQVLKETAVVLRKYPQEKVIVEGHTDSVGTDEYNIDLSRRRAESALTYLVNEERLPRNRFVVRWYGEARPMASNEYDETRALNRRIEIKGQVDDIKRSKLYDQYRTKAAVKINGKPVKVDTNGRFALEVADKSVKKLNVEVTNVRGQSYKTTIAVPSIEILNREEKVLLRYGNKDQEYQVGRPPEARGSDDKTPLVTYDLRGKTEPGNTVEIDGDSIPVQPDGTFATSLSLRRGNNPYGLMVRNPAGISRIVNLMATVNDRDQDGKLIVATGPAPNLQVNLPPKGVPLTSHHLTVTGATDVDNRIFINDEPVKVEINGYFSSIVNLPQGKSLLTIRAVNPEGHSSMITREVEVTDTRLFFLALADGKVEGLMGSGFLQGAGMDEDTEYKTEGRLAFYLKGVIKGKYLITAALDTGSDEFDKLFEDLNERDNNRLLTNLDPNRIYPVYGDSSTVVYDTDSQGKFYLALDSDELHFLLGNYALNLNDTELAAYQRTLFGARIGYQSVSKTQYGDPNTKVTVFGAQVDQIPVTDELLATGGSLYYLSRREVIEGSEQVTLVIRDQNTGLVLAELPQEQNIDYNIIYPAGRILFKRPISTFIESEGIIDQGLLPGNKVSIRVNYEAKNDLFENTAGGGRVRQQIGDHVAVGGTYVNDELDAGQYELQAVDTEIRLGKNTRLVAEYAQSSGTGTLTYLSLDGGLTFAETAPDADREGNAWKVAAELDVGEWFDYPGRYQIGGYYKRLEQGFFTSNNFQEEGTDKSGINLSLGLTQRDKVRARFDRVETDAGSLRDETRRDIGTLQWIHDHEWWSLTGEYQYRDSEDDTAGESEATNYAAARLTVKPIDPLTVEAEHQQTITGNTNNQTTVGLKYQVHPSLALEASGKTGTDGQAAWGGAVLTVGDHRFYLTERLVKDRAGQTRATVLGSESALGKSGKVYSEYQWEHTENGSLNKSVLGAQRQWEVAEGLKMNLSGQYVSTDSGSDDGSQLAIAGGFSYAHPSGFRFTTREEIRRDTGNREMTQLLTSNDLEYKINSDFTSLGWFRWSRSYDDDLDETEASFTELSMGLAYRPVTWDRFNALAKYTWLKQNGPQEPGENEVLKPMTQVAAIDWSLDVTPWMEWAQKGAFRIFSEDVADMPTQTTHSFLSVSRLNFNVWSDWYLGAEYRMLLQTEADDNRQGWLTELMWEPIDHFRIGIGYNFTDFSDNEFSNNDYSTHGLFFRFQGTY